MATISLILRILREIIYVALRFINRILREKNHFFATGSQVKPMPNFLNIFWSTSLSITVLCT